MADSVLARLWNAIKPPPAVHGEPGESQGMNRTQKNMIWATLIVIFLVIGGWQTYAYMASAGERAQKIFEQGMLSMTPGQYQEAIKVFGKAISINPQLGAAYLERGNAESILGQTDAALADYEKAIDVANIAAAYTARGRIYVGRGDDKRAAADFNKSIGIDPSSDGYYQLGQIYDRQGDHAKAVEAYNQAIHIQPDGPYIYRARSQAKRVLGDEAGAAEDRDEAARLESNRGK
jgi:tetratricopeptide (TPR) repeat protein